MNNFNIIKDFKVKSPEVKSPKVRSPKVKSPRVKSPKVKSPRVFLKENRNKSIENFIKFQWPWII